MSPEQFKELKEACLAAVSEYVKSEMAEIRRVLEDALKSLPKDVRAAAYEGAFRGALTAVVDTREAAVKAALEAVKRAIPAERPEPEELTPVPDGLTV